MTTNHLFVTLEEIAQNQIKEISINQIKEIIESIEPNYYKRMIIQEDKIERSNYYYLKYIGKEIERFGKKVEFPLFGEIIEKFKVLQETKVEGKTDYLKETLPNPEILQTLEKNYKIYPLKEDMTSFIKWDSYPIQVSEEGAIIDEQAPYFFPNQTNIVQQEAIFRLGNTTAQVLGDFGSLVFVETTIENHEVEDLFIYDNGTPLGTAIEEELKKHYIAKKEQEAVESSKPQLVYRSFGIYDQSNETIDNYDYFSEKFCDQIRDKLKIDEIHEEQVFYQFIPCIQLSYIHALNNTEHILTIIDPWDKPKIVFHSMPEDTRRGLNDAAKNVSGFFSKMVNKKAHQSKLDRKNEIFLMIRIVLADGEVTDAEKQELLHMIGGLDDFTSSEKQKFYDMMDAKKLPPISENEVQFSDKEISEKVIENLERLSEIDGKDVDNKEESLLNRIKRMINKVNI